MGNISSIQKINFEDMQYAIQNNICIINTLSSSSQKCLIKNTISCDQEESIVNKYLAQRLKKQKIIIYGKNNNDITIFKKYEQLSKLGFSNLYIYVGGLFEWLCLQDIYGKEDFPTTCDELDILKYKSCKINI
tara:strand:+ start:589 stop:987 length:399 start_codon:yes stop_codon:yes gene_type:complete